MSNESILKIEGTEVKVESENEWKTSYFCDEYILAFQIVQRIISENLNKKPNDKYDKIHNIIPFIGKRGTGKTSVMMSFSAMLEKYNIDNRQNEQFYIFKDNKGDKQKVRFYCTDCIDGSLLEKGEDIFKLILAQIYGMFLNMDKNGRPQDKSYEYEKRELLQLFDEVFRSICDLEKESLRDIYYEQSAITSLKSLSSSLGLAKQFEKLVDRYLKLFKTVQPGDNYSETFLVIIVDDLDLNISGGYEMLEKIHRYMMVKNVIVMLSVDYDQIKMLCEKQLYSMVPKFDTKLNEKRAYVDRVARDFLDKIFPGNTRIYMPIFNKLNNVMVKDSEDTIAKSPKDILFKLLYDKLELRIDVEGTKRHFYEQNSLRTFVSFYMMLKNMKSLNGLSDNARQETFLQNYKRLMSDTLNRMTEERLDNKHKEIFRRITKSDLLHSARNFYIEVLSYDSFKDYISEKESWSERNEKQHLMELARNIEESGYNYGELLRIIYCWGRINNESKEMIRCLLAYYTLEFFKEYNQPDWEQDSEKKKWVIDIINGSVVGSWANKIVPLVYVQSEPQMIGMRMNLDMKNTFRYDIDLSEFTLDEEGKIIYNRKVNGSVFAMIKTALIYAMFFEQSSYKRENVNRWKIKKEQPLLDLKKLVTDKDATRYNEMRLVKIGLTASEKDKIEISGEGKANFNVFGFISNAFQYEERIRPLIEDICDILFKKADSKKILKNFDDEFEKWKDISKGFILPVYNMDITYNLIKRLRQRNMGKDKVAVEDIWKEILEIYEFIYDHLKLNDKYYADIYDENYEIFNFSDIFIKCPYMKWIFTATKGKRLKVNDFVILGSDFEKNLINIISNVCKYSAVSGKTVEKEYQSYDD